jgi:magnesium-transporting ATPase (P-type)
MAKSSSKSSSKSASKSKDIQKNIKKMSDKNMIKLIKNLDISPFYTMLVFYVILIAYISGIIHYLNKLQSCACYNDKNVHNYSNLTYLVIVEAIILTLFIIQTIVVIVGIFAINNIKQNGAGKENMNAYLIVSLIINLAITIYFVYNVYKLSENVDPQCDCSENWLRYLLYIQSFIMALGIVGNLTVLGRTLIM